jgi:hypothetical protein
MDGIEVEVEQNRREGCFAMTPLPTPTEEMIGMLQGLRLEWSGYTELLLLLFALLQASPALSPPRRGLSSQSVTWLGFQYWACANEGRFTLRTTVRRNFINQ